ncbi:uncharacterized protein N0V89_006295 [Didymosphaeria variabile]|uniref:Gryzun putative trafficking through Golgi domain-containing protein n=1 Tax=Didymosphaeria variabile TaxID=1932322 RepID=A0A9W8XPI6_9PLEO|nr:uncharacterized protein N0V89_006295 [Didymosphaeria variabile]KAJ4354558.1 hypothetical protein N0V89_006295 [Didymosphaeria variabile]
MNCLEQFPQAASTDNTIVSLDTENYITCLSTTFIFEKHEGNVGEPLTAQIAITSFARRGSAPITLSNVAFQFKGCLSEIHLSHAAGDSVSNNASQLIDCQLEEQTSSTEKPRWSGKTDLMFHVGQTKVFNFPITFRDSGEVEVISSKFDIETERFDLVVSTNELPFNHAPKWWIPSGTTVKPRKLQTGSGSAVKVLPKPPKMEIRLPDVRDHYYTDEPVTLAMEIFNKEDEDTEAMLEVRLLGRSKDSLGYSWIRDAASPMKEAPPPVDNDDMDLPGHVVGRLAKGEKTIEKIRFTAPSDPADYALEVRVLYHLLSDRDIPISKIMIADLVFTSPFETSYELTPRVHPDPWPSYFSLTPSSGDAFGIAQKWHLTAKIASYATETLELKDVAVETHTVHGGATSTITREFDTIGQEDSVMEPQALHSHSFNIDVRKTNLEERRPTAIDTSLNVLWRRKESEDMQTVTTTIPIPRIQIPGGEPRVLASVRSSPSTPGIIHLKYTLENPTMHFLTFEVAMEASEEFGFSGPKLKTLQILPMSRQEVGYVLVPVVKGEGAEGWETEGGKRGWWITPCLRVTDRYFNKTLKVLATDGMRSDKKGVGIWVPGDAGKGPEGEE